MITKKKAANIVTKWTADRLVEFVLICVVSSGETENCRERLQNSIRRLIPHINVRTNREYTIIRAKTFQFNI
jgi:hypothetical protein